LLIFLGTGFMKKNTFTHVVAIGLLMVSVSCTPAGPASSQLRSEVSTSLITREEVLKFVDRWCEGLITLAAAYREGRKVRALAENFIDEMYDYQQAPVLFKPTLTQGEQTFRFTRRGALAYFIGDDADYPNDAGFAIKPWKEARFEIAQDSSGLEGLRQHHDVALVMGQLFLTDVEGRVVTANKSWVLRKDSEGRLKIILHMSALPYAP
jgi:hypothetical protein